jgi:hypothetical protein
MCDICVSATTELETFLDDLQSRYPGTTVEGTDVPPSHHITTALTASLRARLIQEGKFMVAKEAAKRGMTPEAFERQLVAQIRAEQSKQQPMRPSGGGLFGNKPADDERWH